jgi:hypothetical protein
MTVLHHNLVRYKPSTPGYRAVIAQILRDSYILVEDLQKVLNRPLVDLKQCFTVKPTNAIDFTEFQNPLQDQVAKRKIHVKELMLQLHAVYEPLNVFVVPDQDAKTRVPKMTMEQEECVTDLAMNSPLSWFTLGKLMNMSADGVRLIAGNVGYITEPSRVLRFPELDTVIAHFSEVNGGRDDPFNARLQALKRFNRNHELNGHNE